MAIQTDDCDIRDVRFYMTMGGNGDYYVTLIEYPMPESSQGNDTFKIIDYRMSMSGGNTHNHYEVRKAFVDLYRAMEKDGLNNHPKEDETPDSLTDLDRQRDAYYSRDKLFERKPKP